MADYNANIRVSADTSGAARALQQLEQQISKLGQGVELGKSVGRGVTEALVPQKALKQIDRELATIAGRADTTAKKVARIFEGGATLGIAAKGIQDVSQYLQDLSVRAGEAVDALAQIPAVTKAIVPGLKPASDAANVLAKSISTLEYKFSALQGGADSVVNLLSSIGPVAATAGAGIAIVAGAVEDQLLRAMRELDTEGTRALQNFSEQTQQLLRQLSSFGLPRGGTLAQFEQLLGKGQARLRNSPAGSPESLRAINTILRAEELITEELKKQEDLIRAAQGLRTTDVENRATNTYRTTQNRKSFLGQQARDVQDLQAALRELEQTGTNPFGIGPDQQQEALLSRYTDDMKELQQVLGAMEGQSRNPFGITAQQIEIADHNTKKWKADLEQVNAELTDLMAVHRTLGQMEGRRDNPFGIEQQQIEEAYKYRVSEEKAFKNLRLDTIQRQLTAELDSIDAVFDARTKANAAAERDFDRRLSSRVETKREKNQRFESIALGVGFPLLFGGGAGTTLGSLAGSFVGSGFGGQILGGALGQIIDQFAQSAAAMGSALRDPITNFQKIADASLLAGKNQELYVSKLIEVGRITEATAVVQGELIRKIGVSGLNDLNRLGATSSELARAWAELNIQMQAALAGPLADLLQWITSVIRVFGEANRSSSEVKDLLGGLSPDQQAQLQRELLRNNQNYGTSPRALAEEAKILARFRGMAEPPKVTGTSISPEALEQARQAAESSADSIKDAYRQGFRLQQQAIDLQRQGADLQRRVADDIFNKQQQVLRSQIEVDRMRRQITIETVDLEYRRRISNEEGRAAQVLQAEAELMRTKAQGEADIATKRRTLELDIAKQQRDTQNYIYQLNRDIDSIRRATLNYEMDVADYRLSIERKIAEQQRIDQAAGSAAGKGLEYYGPGGAPTAGQRFSSPVEYLTGDRSHPAYRADHGGGNYHEHIAYKTAQEARAAAELLNRNGIRTTELLGVNRVGRHSNGSLHYKGLAFDVPGAQVPVGQEPALSRRVRDLLGIGGNSVASQYENAASTIRRPQITGVDAGGVAGSMQALDSQDARIKRDQLTLQERLNKLGEEAAMQRVLEAARGPKDLQQRREAVALAKAELDAVTSGSRVMQERLAFEAQAQVKLQQRRDVDAEILANTKLTGAARKELEAALAEGLRVTERQVELDRESLRLAQEKQYAIERSNLESQLAVTGSGLRAGFIGNAASAYEGAMLQYGDSSRAQELARLTQEIDAARLSSEALESSIQGIGGAFSEAMTMGVTSVVNGTQTAQQVFAQFLQAVGQALMSAAQQMISTYIAIGIAKMFAGFGSSGGSNMGTSGISEQTLAPMRQYPMLADGGYATANKPHIVGERGPELFVPGTGGTVVSNRDLRSAMGTAPGSSNGPMLNMTFQTTNIGGVEYVSRDQLEAAMASTRKAAAADGARQGTAATLSKLQQSPSTRAKLGLR